MFIFMCQCTRLLPNKIHSVNVKYYVDNLERPGHCFRHTFPNFDGETSTGMMTSSMHLCVASLTYMLYTLI